MKLSHLLRSLAALACAEFAVRIAPPVAKNFCAKPAPPGDQLTAALREIGGPYLAPLEQDGQLVGLVSFNGQVAMRLDDAHAALLLGVLAGERDRVEA